MRILVALCMMSAVAAAAPAFPFDELVHRSQVVFVGELDKHDAKSVTFAVKQTLRGTAPAAHFDFDAVNGDLPKGVTKYLVISQGDDRGKPTSTATVGQGLDAQISFRGWILFPVVNGEVKGAMKFTGKAMVNVKLADVANVLAHSPYKPKG